MPPIFYLCMYWMPVAFCALLSMLAGYQNYKRDTIKCHDEYYVPSFSVGRLIWLLLSPFIPIYNLVVTIYYVIPAILVVGTLHVLELWDIAIIKSKHKIEDKDK